MVADKSIKKIHECVYPIEKDGAYRYECNKKIQSNLMSNAITYGWISLRICRRAWDIELGLQEIKAYNNTYIKSIAVHKQG